MTFLDDDREAELQDVCSAARAGHQTDFSDWRVRPTSSGRDGAGKSSGLIGAVFLRHPPRIVTYSMPHLARVDSVYQTTMGHLASSLLVPVVAFSVF